jgi:hypothetical protein
MPIPYASTSVSREFRKKTKVNKLRKAKVNKRGAARSRVNPEVQAKLDQQRVRAAKHRKIIDESKSDEDMRDKLKAEGLRQTPLKFDKSAPLPGWEERDEKYRAKPKGPSRGGNTKVSVRFPKRKGGGEVNDPSRQEDKFYDFLGSEAHSDLRQKKEQTHRGPARKRKRDFKKKRIEY